MYNTKCQFQDSSSHGRCKFDARPESKTRENLTNHRFWYFVRMSFVHRLMSNRKKTRSHLVCQLILVLPIQCVNWLCTNTINSWDTFVSVRSVITLSQAFKKSPKCDQTVFTRQLGAHHLLSLVLLSFLPTHPPFQWFRKLQKCFNMSIGGHGIHGQQNVNCANVRCYCSSGAASIQIFAHFFCS